MIVMQAFSKSIKNLAKNLLLPLAPILFVSVVSGCGPSSKTAEVHLNILSSNNLRGPSPNLMEAMTQMSQGSKNTNSNLKSADGTCKQANLFAGYRNVNQAKDDSQFIPINMRTPYDLSPGSNDIASWLAINATIPPITINVTKGATVDFGVIGSLSSNQVVPDTDNCATIEMSVIPMLVDSTYSVTGHRDRVTINESTDVNLGLWILAATASPSQTPYAPSICSGDHAPNDQCPGREFYKVTCDNCYIFLGGRLEFHYFLNSSLSGAHPIQNLSTDKLLTGSSISIPSIDDIQVAWYDNNNNLVAKATVAKIDNNASVFLSNTKVSNQSITLTFSHY